MSTHELEYYKNLHYNIIIEKQTDEDTREFSFMAYADELGKMSCYGVGDSEFEALESFKIEKDAFVEYLFNAAKPIPSPKSKEENSFSGIFNVRTSPKIHYTLVKQAEEQNISLNLYLNQILSNAISEFSLHESLNKKMVEISTKMDNHYYQITNKRQYKTIIQDKENKTSNYGFCAEPESKYVVKI